MHRINDILFSFWINAFSIIINIFMAKKIHCKTRETVLEYTYSIAAISYNTIENNQNEF